MTGHEKASQEFYFAPENEKNRKNHYFSINTRNLHYALWAAYDDEMGLQPCTQPAALTQAS